MQVNVSARHGHLSEASQEKISAKAEKLLRIFERLTAIQVVVDLKDNHRPQVDIQVSAEHKHDFVASEQGNELMAVFDSALHKIEQQLRKYKQKVQERHRSKPGSPVEAESEQEQE